MLEILTPPAVEPVGLDAVRAHLRLDHDAEDGALSRYLAAARETVEAATGRALIRQRLRWTTTIARARTAVTLPRAPAIAVERVALGGDDGALRPVDGDRWALEPTGARLRLRGVSAAPGGAVAVTFSAGFGEDAGSVPAALRQAVAMVAAWQFENRGGGGAALSAAAITPLIAPWRRVRL